MFERIARWWRQRSSSEHDDDYSRDSSRRSVDNTDAWAAGASSHSLGLGTGTSGAAPGSAMPPDYVKAYDEGRPRK